MLLRFRKPWMSMVLVVGGSLILFGCTLHSAGPGEVEPAKIEKVSGSTFARVTLTEKAVERLGLETVPAGEMNVPYGALIYGLYGETYVYTNPPGSRLGPSSQSILKAPCDANAAMRST